MLQQQRNNPFSILERNSQCILRENGYPSLYDRIRFRCGSADTICQQYLSESIVGLGPALVTDVRTVRGTAIYTGSTYTIPTTPITPVPNTVLLLRSVKTGAYLTGTNVGINQVNPTYALDINGSARLSGNLFYRKPSYIIYGWANSSNSQPISATTVTPFNASYLAILRQSPDFLLANMFGGTNITVAVAGMYSFAWYARFGNAVTTSNVEVWATWSGPNIQLGHHAGYIFCGSPTFTIPCNVGDTITLNSYSNVANSYVGGVGGDSSLSICLLYMM